MAYSQDWAQWGRSAQHDGWATVAGHRLTTVEATVVVDPLAEAEEAFSGYLLVDYPSVLLDGSDIYVTTKTGAYTGRGSYGSETWLLQNYRRDGTALVKRWSVVTDWKPIPGFTATAGAVLEPACQGLLTGDAVWLPGAGGSLIKISRSSGVIVLRVNPFGSAIDSKIFVAGSPAVDAAGNIYYSALKVDLSNPWGNDVEDSWLVKVGADGNVTRTTYVSLVPGGPSASSQCATVFSDAELPWPPSNDAAAPTAICGAQRPSLKGMPAIGKDGLVYVVSRAQFNDRWGYLVCVGSDLKPIWAASLRNRFVDGCGVTIPSNGTIGGCRSGATPGVDPADNQQGSGRVRDDSTSSPVVTPDGKILYATYTRYNHDQGHLMMFGAGGDYIGSYPAGWDSTPAIFPHDQTYSIVIKENHYPSGSYCNDPNYCPPRSGGGDDPIAYFITQLSATLKVDWKYRSENTLSCERSAAGVVSCVDDHPLGFDWCVSAIAVDGRGVAYAISADGNLYAIEQGGRLRERLLLKLALGAAYSPVAIDGSGRVYAHNDGRMFVVSEGPRRRSVNH